MIERIIISNYKGIRNADIVFNEETNVVVGNNGVGKSTLIEAMSLALGYGLSQLEITPYLFHSSTWDEFRNIQQLPEINIEVIFKDDESLSMYQGKNNSLKEDLVGIRLRISFDEDYQDLFNKESTNCNYIPCEYYKIERYWFSQEVVKQLNVPYSLQIIDSTSPYFNSRTNQFVTKLIQNKLSDDENIQLKGGLRKTKEAFEGYSEIKNINTHLNSKVKEIAENLSITVDLSTKSAWNAIMCPTVNTIPIEQIGLGEQCILKTLLSIDKTAAADNRQSIIIIEEPESHLSHTKMYELLKILKDRISEQLFITTHNSFVANSLDLNNILILNNSSTGLSSTNINKSCLNLDSYKFFFKVCHYPTLRLALCKKAILIEGPTDEMVVLYHYKSKFDKHPFDDGIELISVDGVSFKHYIALAKALNKKIAIITDNDTKDISEIKKLYNPDQSNSIGVYSELNTTLNSLEQSFVNKNLSQITLLSETVRVIKHRNENAETLVKFMTGNKTEWAYRLLDKITDIKVGIVAPDYIQNAINWIKEDE